MTGVEKVVSYLRKIAIDSHKTGFTMMDDNFQEDVEDVTVEDCKEALKVFKSDPELKIKKIILSSMEKDSATVDLLGFETEEELTGSAEVLFKMLHMMSRMGCIPASKKHIIEALKEISTEVMKHVGQPNSDYEMPKELMHKIEGLVMLELSTGKFSEVVKDIMQTDSTLFLQCLPAIDAINTTVEAKREKDSSNNSDIELDEDARFAISRSLEFLMMMNSVYFTNCTCGHCSHIEYVSNLMKTLELALSIDDGDLEENMAKNAEEFDSEDNEELLKYFDSVDFKSMGKVTKLKLLSFILSDLFMSHFDPKSFEKFFLKNVAEMPNRDHLVDLNIAILDVLVNDSEGFEETNGSNETANNPDQENADDSDELTKPKKITKLDLLEED